MRQLQQIERMGKTTHPNSKPGESIVTAAEVALGSFRDLPPARKKLRSSNSDKAEFGNGQCFVLFVFI